MNDLKDVQEGCATAASATRIGIFVTKLSAVYASLTALRVFVFNE